MSNPFQQRLQRGLRLLALDGGPLAQGISILFNLKAVMKHIGKEDLDELPKPYQYFDMIGGTGVGGIIALLLGRLEMGIEEAITNYTQLVDHVLEAQRSRNDVAASLDWALLQVLGGTRSLLLRPEDHDCKVFVTARNPTNMNANTSMLFRSYRSVNLSQEDCTIQQAARATTATPGILDAIVIGRGQYYIGGGMGCNNPVKLVLSEAEDQFPTRWVASIISIGAGHPQTISLTYSPMLQTLKQMAEDSEATHDEMTRRFRRYPDLYYRFNVQQGMQTPRLTPPEVEAHTNIYLGSTATQRDLTKAAAAILKGVGLVHIGDLNSVTNGHPQTHRDLVEKIEELLKGKLAAQHDYRDQGKLECHPKTRSEVLAQINAWLSSSDFSTTDSQCWWVTGVAGVGKTAIALTTVKWLINQQDFLPEHPNAVSSPPNLHAPVLCAQYFFHHKHDTNDLSLFFPTLAMQLASISPDAARVIHDSLSQRPTLPYDKFGLRQAHLLFILPLKQMAALEPRRNMVVVVDGVDELRPSHRGETVQSIYHDVIEVLAQVSKHLPHNARLLILSRPQAEFLVTLGSLPPHICRLHLETTESQRDVRNYLEAVLPKVGQRAGRPGFPSSNQLDLLCTAADGHIGWARQATMWLSARLRTKEAAAINQDIQHLADQVTGDLNRLYTLVLDSVVPFDAEDPAYTRSYVATLQRVLGVIACVMHPQSFHTICVLADKAGEPYSESVAAKACLKDLSGLYGEDADQFERDTTKFIQPHKTFYDYILSQRAPAMFRVNSSRAHSWLATSCFRIMHRNLHSRLHFPSGGFCPPFLHGDCSRRPEKHLVYACASFAQHLALSDRDFTEQLAIWSNDLFFFWLEAILVFLGSRELHPDNLGLAVLNASKYTTIARTRDIVAKVMTLWPFLKRFSTLCSEERDSVLAILLYASILPLIQHPPPHDTTPITVRGGGGLLASMDSLGCVALSPNGEYIAFAIMSTRPNDISDVSIFHTADATLFCPTFHPRWSVESMVFSGERILDLTISDCGGQIMRFDLDSKTHWQVRSNPPAQHPDQDKQLKAKSPFCSVIASKSWIHIYWDSGGGKPLSMAQPTDNDWTSVGLSPDGKFLAAGKLHGEIELFSIPETPPTFSRLALLHGHFDAVTSLAFRPGSQQLISVSKDGTVRVWDVSAALAGVENWVDVRRNGLAQAAWFRHGITLGGWIIDTAKPFLFEYPFALPANVSPLK